MRSLYDDIKTLLEDHTFTIPNVTTRESFDESPKTYPLIVVHEINNTGKTHATVTGEVTTLSYQFDIQTQTCVDSNAVVLSRGEAGRRLMSEVNDLLDTTYKFTRRVAQEGNASVDTLTHILRGDIVLDSNDYAYRP